MIKLKHSFGKTQFYRKTREALSSRRIPTHNTIGQTAIPRRPRPLNRRSKPEPLSELYKSLQSRSLGQLRVLRSRMGRRLARRGSQASRSFLGKENLTRNGANPARVARTAERGPIWARRNLKYAINKLDDRKNDSNRSQKRSNRLRIRSRNQDSRRDRAARAIPGLVGRMRRVWLSLQRDALERLKGLRRPRVRVALLDLSQVVKEAPIEASLSDRFIRSISQRSIEEAQARNGKLEASHERANREKWIDEKINSELRNLWNDRESLSREFNCFRLKHKSFLALKRIVLRLRSRRRCRERKLHSDMSKVSKKISLSLSMFIIEELSEEYEQSSQHQNHSTPSHEQLYRRVLARLVRGAGVRSFGELKKHLRQVKYGLRFRHKRDARRPQSQCASGADRPGGAKGLARAGRVNKGDVVKWVNWAHRVDRAKMANFGNRVYTASGAKGGNESRGVKRVNTENKMRSVNQFKGLKRIKRAKRGRNVSSQVGKRAKWVVKGQRQASIEKMGLSRQVERPQQSRGVAEKRHDQVNRSFDVNRSLRRSSAGAKWKLSAKDYRSWQNNFKLKILR